MLSQWDRPWLDSLALPRRRVSGLPRSANRRRRPAVEALEERTVLSTVFVNAANVGDPAQDGSAAHPFGTIQQGVNVANAGDTVSVAAGTYAESVSVNKPLTLAGTAGDPADVVIDPPADADGIAITADTVIVSDLRVAPSAGRGRNGVTVSGVRYVLLTDVELEKNRGFGLQASGLTTLDLDGVTLLGNTQGGGQVRDVVGVNVKADPFTTYASLVPYSATLAPGSFVDTRAGVTRQGIDYTNVSDLTVGGTGNDSFAVAPSPDTELTVWSPSRPQGSLDMNLAGATAPTLTPVPLAFYLPPFAYWGAGMGTWSFGNCQPVHFQGMAHLTPGMGVSGQVFDDVNASGTRDPGEPALAGYTVLLDAPDGGPADQTAVTDGAGGYAFTDLVPAVYRVTLIAPPGQVTTAPAGGAYRINARGGPPDALAVSGQDFGVITNANRAFVYEAHLDLLQRAIGPGSLAAWQARLDKGTVSRAAVAEAFLKAPEYRLVTARGLFQAYLGRAGTARELRALARLLKGPGGLPRAQARLLGSRGYFRTHGGTVAGWLTAAYRDATGLGLSARARHRDRGLLAQGAGRERVALLMLTSPAGRTALVKGWSSRYLHRPLSGTDLASYLLLLRQGWSEDRVLARMIGSPAYPAGLVGGLPYLGEY